MTFKNFLDAKTLKRSTGDSKNSLGLYYFDKNKKLKFRHCERISKLDVSLSYGTPSGNFGPSLHAKGLAERFEEAPSPCRLHVYVYK